MVLPQQKPSGVGPKKSPAPPPKPTGFFGERKERPMIELQRAALQKRAIPGVPGKWYSRPEVKKMIEKRLPWKEVGSHISEQEHNRLIKKLRMERFKAKTGAERLAIDREIRYWEELRK